MQLLLINRRLALLIFFFLGSEISFSGQLPGVMMVCATSSAMHQESTMDDYDNPYELPSMLDADDIAYFFSTYDIEGLHWALSSVFAQSDRMAGLTLDRDFRGQEHNEIRHSNKLSDQIISRGGGSNYTTLYKLQMDLEQAEYHLQDVFSPTLEKSSSSSSSSPQGGARAGREQLYDYFKNIVIPTYKQMISRIPPLDQLHRTKGLYPFRASDYGLGINDIYNKALYVPDHYHDYLSSSNDDGLYGGRILNPKLNLNKIQSKWMDQVRQKEPEIVVVDDVLSSHALEKIRQLMMESTVWYQTKMPLKFGGYVGAYIDDGLHQRILLALAMDLHRALPQIMKQHHLRYMWAYKYDSRFSGINLHADQAAINVNLWITPSDANLDPRSGGLVIYTSKPPPDWDFVQYNTNTERVVEELLKPNGYANVTVPYRGNRAVIFDSSLFHHTDEFKFKEGHKNRRINLTLLYGANQLNAGDDSGDDSSGSCRGSNARER